MAELIIQNPSITTNVFEYDDAGRVSAISGHPLAGQGGGEIVKSDLMWKPTVGADGYVRWTLASSATEPDAAYISGAQGPQGPSGTNGKDGKDGTNGTNGANGISPTFTITPTAGGTHVVLSGAQGEESFDVLSGAKGADGTAGFSPLFTITDADTGTYPQGGKHVAIQYGDGGLQNTAFDILNGIDGTGATVNLFGNNGVSISKDGTDYTVGLSGGYYSDTLSAYSAMYAGYASNAKFSDNSVSSMDQIKGSIDDGNRVAYETSASLFTASAKWDEVSAKSHTTIDSNQVVTTENNGTSATVSAVQYVTNDSFSTAPKQLFVCQDDNDLTAHLNICNGKGTLFFVCSAI